MGKGSEKTFFLFFQRSHTGSQHIHEKVLNITNHQGNIIQTTVRNYVKPVRMAHITKTREKTCWSGYEEK